MSRGSGPGRAAGAISASVRWHPGSEPSIPAPDASAREASPPPHTSRKRQAEQRPVRLSERRRSRASCSGGSVQICESGRSRTEPRSSPTQNWSGSRAPPMPSPSTIEKISGSTTIEVAVRATLEPTGTPSCLRARMAAIERRAVESELQ